LIPHLLSLDRSSGRDRLFIFMSRNAWNATSSFKLPPERVVELGNQVEL
jgi:KUP system potassium uptake protein